MPKCRKITDLKSIYVAIVLVVVPCAKHKVDEALVGDDIDQNYHDLKAFNTRNIELSLSRAKNEHDVDVVRMIYGL